MSISIGSLNVYKMGANNPRIREIADLIRKEQMDIVALQEIYSSQSLQLIRDELNKRNRQWECEWKEPHSLTIQASEGYGFLWNTKKVELVPAPHNPYVANRYRVKDIPDGRGLIRPPLVARFIPVHASLDSCCEIRLINTHIAYGKSVKLETDLGEVANRKAELDILLRQILYSVKDKRYGNFRDAYTFVLGDYNLCLVTSPQIQEEIVVNDHFTVVTRQGEKTSLTENSQGEVRLVHDYDHFSYDRKLDDMITLKVMRINGIDKYYNGKPEDYRNRVSDHLPVKLILKATKRGRTE